MTKLKLVSELFGDVTVIYPESVVDVDPDAVDWKALAAEMRISAVFQEKFPWIEKPWEFFWSAEEIAAVAAEANATVEQVQEFLQ